MRGGEDLRSENRVVCVLEREIRGNGVAVECNGRDSGVWCWQEVTINAFCTSTRVYYTSVSDYGNSWVSCHDVTKNKPPKLPYPLLPLIPYRHIQDPNYGP